MKAEVLDALVAAGVTAEQLAAALKAEMRAEEERKEIKRAKDAERQRRYRARVTPVTRDNADVTAVTCDPSPDKESPHTPKEITPNQLPPSPPKGGSSPKACRLPDDWEPDLQVALDEGFSASDARREAEKFRDYWRSVPGQKGVKLDWPATWRNWIRRAAEDQRKRGPPPTLRQFQTRADPMETLLRAANEVREVEHRRR